MKFYESLTNTTSSTAFLCTSRTGSGARVNVSVTLLEVKFIAVSALYICNKLNRCFRVFPHRILGYRHIFIMCIHLSNSDLYQLSLSSLTTVEHTKPLSCAGRVPFRHHLSSSIQKIDFATCKLVTDKLIFF